MSQQRLEFDPAKLLPTWPSVMKLEICQECGPTIKPRLTREPGPEAAGARSYAESVTKKVL